MACACNALFRSLGEQSKAMIIDELLLGPKSIGEIAEKLKLEQSRTSHAIAVLEEVGIVEKEREGKRVVCRIAPSVEPILRKLDELRNEYHECRCCA